MELIQDLLGAVVVFTGIDIAGLDKPVHNTRLEGNIHWFGLWKTSIPEDKYPRRQVSPNIFEGYLVVGTRRVLDTEFRGQGCGGLG